MTIGEKIKLYRNTNKLTQKRLAELSGVSEISICKYEAGERNPKIEQLRKIADALPIGGESLLADESLSIKIDTVGDFMTYFYAMMEKVGCQFYMAQGADGSVDPFNIAVKFNNHKINKCLERIATEDALSCKDPSLTIKSDDGVVNIERTLADKFLLDLTRTEFIKRTDPLLDTE